MSTSAETLDTYPSGRSGPRSWFRTAIDTLRQTFADWQADKAPKLGAALAYYTVFSLARIRSLVLPPAWTDVRIAIHSNGHLQATGRDARGFRRAIRGRSRRFGPAAAAAETPSAELARASS